MRYITKSTFIGDFHDCQVNTAQLIKATINFMRAFDHISDHDLMHDTPSDITNDDFLTICLGRALKNNVSLAKELASTNHKWTVYYSNADLGVNFYLLDNTRPLI